MELESYTDQQKVWLVNTIVSSWPTAKDCRTQGMIEFFLQSMSQLTAPRLGVSNCITAVCRSQLCLSKASWQCQHTGTMIKSDGSISRAMNHAPLQSTYSFCISIYCIGLSIWVRSSHIQSSSGGLLQFHCLTTSRQSFTCHGFQTRNPFQPFQNVTGGPFSGSLAAILDALVTLMNCETSDPEAEHPFRTQSPQCHYNMDSQNPSSEGVQFKQW